GAFVSKMRVRMVKPVDPFWSGAKRRKGHLAAKGGPKLNAWPRAKIDVRAWIAGTLGGVRSVYEVYGAGGLGSDCWRRHGAETLAGTPGGADAIASLRDLQKWDYDVWDVDPYSNPFTAIVIIGERATAPRIGMFVTDGCLRKGAQIRAK